MRERPLESRRFLTLLQDNQAWINYPKRK